MRRYHDTTSSDGNISPHGLLVRTRPRPPLQIDAEGELSIQVKIDPGRPEGKTVISCNYSP